MKRYLTMLALLLCTAFAGRAQEADYSVDRIRHDFGKLASGKSYTTTFTVTSAGMAPLVLIDAQTGCKCTKAEFGKKPLRRGEKVSVTVTFDAAEEGFFDKQIRIRTNVPGKRAVLMLRVTGDVLE